MNAPSFELEDIKSWIDIAKKVLETETSVYGFYLLNRYVYSLSWILKQDVVPFNQDDYELYLEFIEKYKAVRNI